LRDRGSAHVDAARFFSQNLDEQPAASDCLIPLTTVIPSTRPERDAGFIHRPNPRWWQWVGTAAVLVLAARLMLLTIEYLFARRGVMRYQVEASATAFVIVALVFRWVRNQKDFSEWRQRRGLPATTLAIWCALALVLYGRMLFTGFLSDDYVLVDRASHWNVGAVTTNLFRPIPLTLWAVLLHAGAGPLVLHLVNIIVHGTNAFLVSRVTGRWMSRRLSMLSAGLFLTFPLSPEAVVWCSGVFDVLATALVLGCVLASRGYDAAPTLGRRCWFLLLGLAALLCKETAAVVGVLVLFDAWLRRSRNRALIVDAGILLAAAAGFGATRVSASDLLRRPLSKFAVQRFFFGEFGSLAVPWHIDVIRHVPWLPAATVTIVVGCFLKFVVADRGGAQARVALVNMLWVIVAGAPLITFFYVGPDLQGSRYLYLPAVGWAALLVTMAGGQDAENTNRIFAKISEAAVVALVVTGAIGLWLHQQPWQRAAGARNEVEAAAHHDVLMASCPLVQLAGLPDSVEGAYIFRNGVTEAFARDIHLNAVVARSGGLCAFQWNPRSGIFTPIS
jgi:hypothetical protein